MENYDMIQRSFSVPKYIMEQIKKDAKKEYVSESSIVRKILIKYYEDKEDE